jgi:hypothetical protein
MKKFLMIWFGIALMGLAAGAVVSIFRAHNYIGGADHWPSSSAQPRSASGTWRAIGQHKAPDRSRGLRALASPTTSAVDGDEPKRFAMAGSSRIDRLLDA